MGTGVWDAMTGMRYCVCLLTALLACPLTVCTLVPVARIQEVVAQHLDSQGMVDLSSLTTHLSRLAALHNSLEGVQPTAQCFTAATVPKVLALIPARSGSKSVPHKNIRVMGGAPMIVHSIRHAQASQQVTRVMVSTDSEEYRQIALAAGAEAPFLRPAALAQDLSPDLPAFTHALEWLRQNEGYVPDLVVH